MKQKMISAQAPYDSVLVRLNDGRYSTNFDASRSFVKEAEALLETVEYQASAYSTSLWTRTDTGKLLLIRDVYNTLPLYHVGKVAVNIRQERLASLGGYNRTLNCAILFFDEAGRYVTSTGVVKAGMEEAVREALTSKRETVTVEKTAYALARNDNGSWTAVGLMPMSIFNGVQNAILGSSLFVAVLGICFGALLVPFLTHGMAKQVRTLVSSMDAVSAGNVDLVIPVECKDEIGQLAVHFNRMIAETRFLLKRVVQEETSKRMAEYEILEYKYFSLQSQINPHFIYNALEIVNAQAKLDGNMEIYDMIQHISAYFRQCAQNARNKLVTVQQEFEGLSQYAYIYCRIHGDSLKTLFHYDEDVSDTLIPTMVIQPLLENALIHGLSSTLAQTVVETDAWQEDDSVLMIEIRDNGCGMSQETIRRILNSEREAGETEPQRNGIGIRNVLDRLKLIYGDQATLSIESELGEGTTVRIRIPRHTADLQGN